MLKYFFRGDSTTPVDDLITKILNEMQKEEVTSEDYQKMLNRLDKLFELKAKEKPSPVSRDTMALIAGNLMGILLIVAYEQKHVMTSKGFNQIIRPK